MSAEPDGITSSQRIFLLFGIVSFSSLLLLWQCCSSYGQGMRSAAWHLDRGVCSEAPGTYFNWKVVSGLWAGRFLNQLPVRLMKFDNFLLVTHTGFSFSGFGLF